MSIRKSIRRLASHSCWSQIQKVNTDSIMKLTEQYKSDKNEKKVNLSIGAYKDSCGNPYILPSVREARKKHLQTNHEYSTRNGCLEFNHYSQHFYLVSTTKINSQILQPFRPFPELVHAVLAQNS